MTESPPGATTALREALAAANARAEKAVAEIVNEQRRFGEMQREAWKLEEALAAARRECEGLRKVLDVARAALESGQDLWPAIQQARAALSSEGESK